MDSFVEQTVAELKERIGDGKVLCALSGGVDSSVCAAMLAKAIRQTTDLRICRPRSAAQKRA